MHIETRLLFESFIKINDENNSVEKTCEEVLKVAHLSDLHIGRMFVSKYLIKKTILKNKPDCIVLTGDYIEKTNQIKKFIRFLEYINPYKIPVFIVWGNHDHKVFKNYKCYDELKAILLNMNITVLENENKVIQKNSEKYFIVGIDELFYGKPDVEKAFFGTKINDKKIVLSHNPDMFFSIEDKRFQILLSGHFHGGQIYLPFNFEFKMLRSEILAKMKFTKGLRELNGHKIYINRGIGNVLFPFRFLSPPEIAYIYIR
jgi:predicted MPP superfamily phosphohydrolase